METTRKQYEVATTSSSDKEVTTNSGKKIVNLYFLVIFFLAFISSSLAVAVALPLLCNNGFTVIVPETEAAINC